MAAGDGLLVAWSEVQVGVSFDGAAQLQQRGGVQWDPA
jgi:hypothetical protein